MPCRKHEIVNRSSKAYQPNKCLHGVVERIIKSTIDGAYPGPTNTREFKPHKETRCPVGVVATEENKGSMDQGRDKGSYDYEVAVRNLPLQNTSTIGKRKPIIGGTEAPPREQQMSERRHEQQKSDRNKNVLIRKFSLYPHLKSLDQSCSQKVDPRTTSYRPTAPG